jgi:hypothetical protein
MPTPDDDSKGCGTVLALIGVVLSGTVITLSAGAWAFFKFVWAP